MLVLLQLVSSILTPLYLLAQTLYRLVVVIPTPSSVLLTMLSSKVVVLRQHTMILITQLVATKVSRTVLMYRQVFILWLRLQQLQSALVTSTTSTPSVLSLMVRTTRMRTSVYLRLPIRIVVEMDSLFLAIPLEARPLVHPLRRRELTLV